MEPDAVHAAGGKLVERIFTALPTGRAVFYGVKMDHGNWVSIRVNGEEKKIRSDTGFRDFLEEIGLVPESIVAEINGQLLPREAFAGYKLQSGDRVEMIRFVGGG